MKKLLSSFLLIGIVAAAGCITNTHNRTDTAGKVTQTEQAGDVGCVTVGGYLSYYNEKQHGVWFVEVVQGAVETVKVKHTNDVVWAATDFASTDGGILILSKPEPLSIGDQYRVTLTP
jgi:hypothetical protein